MRVLLLAQHYSPIIGGEERHVQNLAAQLSQRGHEVHVGTLALDGNPTFCRDESGVHVHRLGSLSARLSVIHEDPQRPHALPVPDPVLTARLGELVARVNPDVVHAHNWIINSFLPIQRRSPGPLVMSLHGYEHRCATTRYLHDGAICDGPRPAKCLACAVDGYGYGKGPVILASTWLMKPWKERLIDRFLPVSSAVARATGLEQHGVPHTVVPNFVPDDLLAAHAASETRPPELPSGDYLLFVGDLSHDKGITTVLRAYEGLASPRPRQFVIGRRTAAMPSDTPDGVIVAHDWAHELVASAFRHALAAVLPSHWADPCPTTVLEAMALGAPLITTPVGGIVDMVDEASALLVAPDDSDRLRDAMSRLIRDRPLRERLAAAAATRVQHFAASSVVPRIEAVYEEVVAGHRLKRRGAA